VEAQESTPSANAFDLYSGSPEYVSKSWTVQDGLPLNMVWALEQTQEGLLWVGTAEGLAAFDGFGVTTYDGTETGGLAANKIRALHEDQDGTLWIGTPTGVSVRRDGRFRQVEGPSHIRAFGEDPAGRVWMVGPSGLYHSASEGVTRVALPDTLEGIDTLSDVAPVGTDSVWVATGHDLLLYHNGALQSADLPLLRGPAQALDGGPEGRLWVATPREVVVHGPDTTERYAHDGGGVYEVQGDSAGGAWVATTSASLLRIDEGTLRAANAASHLSAKVHSIERDPAGQWWVGTHRNGLMRLRPRLMWPVSEEAGIRLSAQGVYADDRGSVWVGTGFQKICAFATRTRTCYRPDDGLPTETVHSIQEDATGALWVSTDDGLVRRRGARFEPVQMPDGRPFNDRAALHRDRAGTLWIASRQGLFRHRAGTIERRLPADRMPSMVLSMHRGQSGAVWIGTRNRGLARYEEGRLRWFDGDDGVPYKNVRDIYETDDGTIWIGTYGGGIARYEGDRFTPVTPEEGLPAGTIHAIREAPAGTFWMTSNDGLFRVPRAQVEAVADGQRDQLYAQVLGPEDGMPARESNGAMHPAMTQDQAGRLWFSTVKGAGVIDPQAPALAVPDSIPLRVTGLRTDGTAQPLDSLRLAPSTYRVALDFSATSLRRADDLSFRYRLDGKTWTPAHGRRTAEFTSLDAGTHDFEVQATIDGETWYTLDAPLRFTVLPHFYQTWWFRVLVALSLLGLGIAAYRWRVRRLERRQEELENAVETRTEELARAKEKTERQAERLQELDEAKSRFFARVSHEFRTPLSLLFSPLRDAAQQEEGLSTDQVERMLPSAERLRRLIDRLLDLATLDAGGMELDLRPGDLAALVERTAEAFRSEADRTGVTLTVERPETGLPTRLDTEKVETVVSNLVSNALRHTPEGGTVAVRLRRETAPDAIDLAGDTAAACIAVADTGAGIPEDEQERVFDQFAQAETASDAGAGATTDGLGLGLALTRELVELHGGAVELDSAPGEGSTFRVWLPLLPIENDTVEADAEATGGPNRRDAAPGEAPGGDGSLPETGDASVLTADAPAVRTGEAEILVVEDNDTLRTVLCEQLSAHWTVREAADGGAAWDELQASTPDLVLSDVMMPGPDGFALCEKIKSDPDLRAVPVVLLTARTADEDTLEGLECGADDYVAKPFDPAELIGRLDNHLTAREHLRERHRREVRVTPIETVVDEEELPFVEELVEVIETRLSDPDLTVSRLADAVALSRRQLTRRLKDAVGQTPAAFLRERRVKRAKELLADDPGTIAEVAYAVGFRSPSSFTKTFREETGQTPTEYVKEHGA